MKIYLSVNNGADILTVPVIPPEFTVQKPQGGSAFETISSGELNLIGLPKLKSISWSSFFPIRGYSYLQDTSMKGFEYGYKLDTWILQKLPIRLIISETPINMAVSIENFEYKIGTDGDLYYTLALKEFPLVNNPELEGDLTQMQYDELKSMIESNTGRIEALEGKMIYNWIDENMPEEFRPTIQKLCDYGLLKGTETGLGLTDEMIRVFVVLDRMGLFDYDFTCYQSSGAVPEWGRETVEKLMNSGGITNPDGELELTRSVIMALVILGRVLQI